MTPSQRQQLDRLLQEQHRLTQTVQEFGERLDRFLWEVQRSESILPQSSSAALEVPVLVPPAIRTTEERAIAIAEPKRTEAAPSTKPEAHPPPLPAGLPPSATPASGFAPKPPPSPPSASKPKALAPERGSLEMTLGTVWLARIGIVILLTGLVFLGNYAWQHIVHTLGPAGKLSLLAMAGGALIGLGVFLEKRLATTRAYAQVLKAGGAATLYYTTYAAHFVQPLRVIESPLVGGLLLLAVAGLFLWWSDRRRLQTAALLAIGLSYYTSAINPVGTFTLYSSVLLSGAASFLLVRHGWAMVSWLSLAGTYLSFVFWRFYVADAGVAPTEAGYAELWLLALYWVIFTTSALLARTTALSGPRRAAFLTLNNGLFFWLASQHLLAVNPAAHWIFALSYGAILLGLAAIARRREAAEYELDGAYLVQGLAAVTAGLALKLTGPSLAVTLALESALLLAGVRRRHGVIYQLAAGIIGAWSFGLAFSEMNGSPGTISALGSTVSALLLLDAWWLKQRLGLLSLDRWSWRVFGFAACALFLAGVTLVLKVHAPWEPASLALAGLVATASIYLLRLPEVVVLGQGYLAVAVGVWVIGVERTPWSIPVSLLLSALLTAHWWQKQRSVFPPRARDSWQVANAAFVVAVGYAWLWSRSTPETWMVSTTVVAMLSLFYSYTLRLWSLALLGQVFLFCAVATRLNFFSESPPTTWGLALLPMVALAVGCLVFGAGDQQGWPTSLRQVTPRLALLYWIAGWVLYLQWVFSFVGESWQNLALAAPASLLLLLTCRHSGRVALFTGFSLYGIAVLYFLGDPAGSASWQQLLTLLLLPATLRLAARLCGGRELLPPAGRNTAVGLTTAALVFWVTRWVHLHQAGHLLTLAWSALAVAVFCAGLTLRDRVYRLGGFLILALAIGRVFCVDVWQLETIYRILSFLGLGITLLALGFVYNRYAERIQKWL